ncbi:septal ring lytic transglycosylase RlpA family protein [Collimonas pratensis]|uniref:septal ring lytic transglycosylase RlpA family protein n=1 Tax=Collimonas pratensis TaxID=279113 RepID=UPI00143CCB0F|nr:septal ring lytic transglycosylase RlpA family protein [Collimonas pratensis]NKI72531.1 septal ring lytic transglycosylase RlpA family protein [Collimonas pratensis]
MMPSPRYRMLLLLRVSACACMLWLPATQTASAVDAAADAAPVQAHAGDEAAAATQQAMATPTPARLCPAPADDHALTDDDAPKKPVQRGMASWYGGKLHGRKSASGERFNMHAMTAAHPSLPLHSWVLVRNVGNGKMALLKVNDRGPFHSKRILDVSYSAAKQLGFAGKGTARVEVRPLSPSEMTLVKAQIAHGITPAGDAGDCDASEQ